MHRTLHRNPPRDAAIHKQIGLTLALLAAIGPAVPCARAQTPASLVEPIIITVLPKYYIPRPAPPALNIIQQGNPCITSYADAVLPRDLGNSPLIAAANRGIEEYITANRIPKFPRLGQCDTPAMRLLRHKRNDARAAAFLAVLTAAVKTDRTAEDNAVVQWMTNLVKNKWMMATGNALSELQDWKTRPCDYAPPEGSNYDPGPSCPASPETVVAGTTRPTFSRIGGAQAYPALRTPQGGSAAMGTATALGEMLDAIEAQQVNGVFATLAPLAMTMGNSLTQFSADPAGLAISATVTAVLNGVEASRTAQTELNLRSASAVAEKATPDISAMVKTEGGLQQMFAAFIETTLFNGLDPDFPVPPRGPSTRRLTIQQLVDPTKDVTADVFEYRAWDWSVWSAYIDSGWFVHTPPGDGQPHMDYRIRYKGADGSNWIAQMNGEQEEPQEFLISNAGGTQRYSSPGLRYIHQGTRVIALINARPPLSLAHTNLAHGSFRKENRIDYIGWDGKEWSAIFVNPKYGLFKVRQRGGIEYNDSVLKYVTWDGSKWRAYYNSELRKFFHYREGAITGHSDVIMNYKTWNLWKGGNYTVRIE